MEMRSHWSAILEEERERFTDRATAYVSAILAYVQLIFLTGGKALQLTPPCSAAGQGKGFRNFQMVGKVMGQGACPRSQSEGSAGR